MNCLIVSFLLVPLHSSNAQDPPSESQALSEAKRHVEGGGKVEAQLSWFLRPDRYCEGTRLHRACMLGHLSVVEYLLEQGADPQSEDLDIKGPSYSRTPLGLAALFGHDRIVERLLEKGADAGHTAAGDEPPIWCAAFGGDLGVVQLLHAKGAKLDAMGRERSTPLHAASQQGAIRIVEWLLRQKVPTVLENDERPPVHRALQGGQVAVATLLVHYGASVETVPHLPSPLALAAATGDMGIIDLILDRGAAVDDGGEGDPPLIEAARGGHANAVGLLLFRGADVNARNGLGETALHCATQDRTLDKRTAFLLMERGADVNAKKKDGSTPLHRAMDGDVIRMLARLGADVDARDTQGNSPLHWACMWNEAYAAGVLVEVGAKRDVMNGEGKKPIDLTQNPDIRQLLGGV